MGDTMPVCSAHSAIRNPCTCSGVHMQLMRILGDIEKRSGAALMQQQQWAWASFTGAHVAIGSGVGSSAVATLEGSHRNLRVAGAVHGALVDVGAADNDVLQGRAGFPQPCTPDRKLPPSPSGPRHTPFIFPHFSRSCVCRQLRRLLADCHLVIDDHHLAVHVDHEAARKLRQLCTTVRWRLPLAAQGPRLMSVTSR